MGKLVVFKISEGNFEQGFPITLQIGEDGEPAFAEMTRKLPPAPLIPELYSRWINRYRQLGGMNTRIHIPDSQMTNISREEDWQECLQLSQMLRDRLNDWLRHPACLDLRELVIAEIQRHEPVRVLLQTQDWQLRRLPWHLWDLFERYPKAEIALSVLDYKRFSRNEQSLQDPVSILAILGANGGIDVECDRHLLSNLPQADIYWLIQPTIQQLNDYLWQSSWDILFFAGHSSTCLTHPEISEPLGRLHLNSQETLTLTQLKSGLIKAVERGLKLAIFNSCNGLGLAEELAEVQIPQVIVMREPVPDRVAQEFIRYFLTEFSIGIGLYEAVRNARDRLQGLEHQFPCATWLPVICQNPAFPPLTWNFSSQSFPDYSLETPPASPVLNYPLREISTQEQRRRQILVNKVKNYWVKGVLETSLHGRALIELGLEERLEEIEHPWGLLWESCDLPRQTLPKGVKAIEKFDELGLGRSLLILGEPGSGKTTTLLELARDLIERAETEKNHPIPVVFNLSSWASKKPSLSDWLIRELYSKYQVPAEIGRNWVEDQQLLLLLDGLDEVSPNSRQSCVEAINQFLQSHGQTEIVVCSRIADYRKLPTKIRLMAAIYLQPLTGEQIQQYLQNAGVELSGLKDALNTDKTLLKLAQSPLMLSIMTLAYQGNAIATLPQGNYKAHRQHLFNAYIERMFNRKGSHSTYSKIQTKQWLIQLAKWLKRDSQTVFLIERIQPNYLANRLQKTVYAFSVALLGGIIAALGIGLSIGHIAGGQVGLISGLVLGLGGGLSGGIILISVLPQIEPVEKLKWSWKKARITLIPGLQVGLIAGGIYALGVGLLFHFIYKQNLSAKDLLSFWISGLNLGVMFILLRGLTGGDIEARTVPNQGIWMSLKNAAFFAIVGIITLSVLATLVGHPTLFGAIAGLMIGLFSPGTVACLQHFVLRSVLYYYGYTPWNYARFLDYATGLIFLQKVGGGYIFIHRLLLEHFAQMTSE